MDLNPWNCCRTCLNTHDLYPIFQIAEHHEKYSNIIITVTGIKVIINDSLPQDMCSLCITFINESIKFRMRCETTQSSLLNRVNEKQFNDIKLEIPLTFKEEQYKTTIDITHLITNIDDDFKDYDDNVTLQSLQSLQHDNVIHIAERTKGTDLISNTLKTEKLSKNKISCNKKTKCKVNRSKKENTVEEKSSERKEPVQCEYCNKTLTSKTSLRNHYKIHTGFDVVCEHCGKKFITRRLLLMHCRAKHGYEKTDKCSYCDYRGSNAEQVKIHERLHTGERPFRCVSCGAGFARRSSYLQHVAIHLPDKSVQCDICPARFKSVTLMRIHKNRHRESQYSFRCRVCENSFSRRRNVVRHLVRIHGLPPDGHIDRRKIQHTMSAL